MIMQEMWIVQTRWDESLTDDLCVKVRKWFDKLKQFRKSKVLEKKV